jgi:hypothetical protein
MFARVVAADDVQGAANALLARRLGVRRRFLLDDGGEYGGRSRSPFAERLDRWGSGSSARATGPLRRTSWRWPVGSRRHGPTASSLRGRSTRTGTRC